jgi:hypothetical protein
MKNKCNPTKKKKNKNKNKNKKTKQKILSTPLPQINTTPHRQMHQQQQHQQPLPRTCNREEEEEEEEEEETPPTDTRNKRRKLAGPSDCDPRAAREARDSATDDYDYAQAYLDEFTSLGRGRRDVQAINELGGAYPLTFYRETLRRMPSTFGIEEFADDPRRLEACAEVFRIMCGPPDRRSLRDYGLKVALATRRQPFSDLFAKLPYELAWRIFGMAQAHTAVRLVCGRWRDLLAEMLERDREALEMLFLRALLRLLVLGFDYADETLSSPLVVERQDDVDECLHYHIPRASFLIVDGKRVEDEGGTLGAPVSVFYREQCERSGRHVDEQGALAWLRKALARPFDCMSFWIRTHRVATDKLWRVPPAMASAFFHLDNYFEKLFSCDRPPNVDEGLGEAILAIRVSCPMRVLAYHPNIRRDVETFLAADIK